MKGKLPKVFVNDKVKIEDNNQRIYYSKNKEVINKNKLSVLNQINNIFSSKKFVYKMPVFIKTEKKEYKIELIGKKDNVLIGKNNEIIKIDDIIEIKANN